MNRRSFIELLQGVPFIGSVFLGADRVYGAHWVYRRQTDVPDKYIDVVERLPALSASVSNYYESPTGARAIYARSGDVIVLTDSGRELRARIDYVSGDDQGLLWLDSDNRIICGVTHWREIQE